MGTDVTIAIMSCFAEMNEFTSIETKSLVHIRVQQRKANKYWTTIEGICSTLDPGKIFAQEAHWSIARNTVL